MRPENFSNGTPAEPAESSGKPRLAVIGSGLGGLAAAWLLRQQFDVTVFEQHARPGMGVFTVDYTSRGATTRIDIPTRVFCEGYYPHLFALLKTVGVHMHATDHSAAYGDARGEVFFHYGNLRVFGRSVSYPKGASTFSADARCIGLDSGRFFAQARKDLAAHPEHLAQQTLDHYLDDHLAAKTYGAAFVQQVLLPALSVICTCDYDSVLAYPADLILGYLCSGVMQQGVVRAEKGVDDIVPRLLADVQQVCGQAVARVEESVRGMTVTTADGVGRHFESVVVAAQAHQAAAMLHGFDHYKTLLEQVPFEASSMLVHTDHALLPRTRVPLSPVTYHLPDEATRPEVTVDLTKAFPTYRKQDSVFQTWNPIRQPRAECVIAEAHFTRPLVTMQSRQAMAALRKLQQEEAQPTLWFCGAYVSDRVPLLEAAAASAVDVARRLGVTIPWDA
ncbi:NAD(P)-binding protein [Panacagrimonas sp.]|uniref:NAD(P)-binding protein n=1 Tax=Panacagrimonas sp. TaxID=2480088 RepID=UPI003B522CB7